MARENTAQQEMRWLAFITSLPVEDPAARMRVLRTLEALGCAVLREGVFLLPDTVENTQALSRLTEHVTRLGGGSHVLRVESRDQAQTRQFQSLFDRSSKYEQLSKTVESLSAGYGIADPSSIARIIAKQKREYESISALDFFPSAARERAARLIDEATQKINGLMFPQEAAPKRSPAADNVFKARTWATRRPLWADRLACAWLVRRFIDPEAKLIWLDSSQAGPENAVTFGFEGADFSNSRSLVTFERLLAHFGMEKNATLVRLGTLVHYLDAGGTPVAEAAGVETLLQGARRRSADDDQLFAETEKTFDLLYEAYFDPSART